MLPARLDRPDLTPRQTRQAQRLTQETHLELFQHHLAIRFELESHRFESQAAASAARDDFDEELAFLQYGRARAGDDPAALQLLGRHLEALNRANARRYSRRFD